MSPLLQEFYDEMFAAIGNRQPYWFLHSGGLCLNLKMFLSYKNINSDDSEATKWELKQQFIKAKLNTSIPFNESKIEFQFETNKYENTLRTDWIRSHITRVPLGGLRNKDHTKCSIERLGVCGCAFGQCAKGLIF